MFLENTIVIFTEALKRVFDSEHPVEEMRGLPVKVEYPLDAVDYPCLWVQFIPQGDVRNVGIGHVERRVVDGVDQILHRWNFSGVIEIVVAALSSLERARMMDALTKTIAAGVLDSDRPESDFRRYVETNDLIGFRVIWESFTVGGSAETPGTPWGTDDVIYEVTLSLTIEGEFYFAPYSGEVVPLSEIVVNDPVASLTPAGEPDPTEGWR